MDTLGVGIIGCGAVAAEYIKAVQKDIRSEIRTLVSRNPENAQKFLDFITSPSAQNIYKKYGFLPQS